MVLMAICRFEMSSQEGVQEVGKFNRESSDIWFRDYLKFCIEWVAHWLILEVSAPVYGVSKVIT